MWRLCHLLAVALPFMTMSVGARADVTTLSTVRQTSAAPQSGNSSSGAIAVAIDRFYRSRGEDAVWLAGETLNLQGEALLAVLADAGGHGIDWLPSSSGSFGEYGRRQAGEPAAAYDRRLTGLFLELARALRIGRVTPEDLGMTWGMARPIFDPVMLLSALESGQSVAALLEAQAPPFESYRLLVSALPLYRDSAARGGWPMLPAGPTFGPGQSGAKVALLRLRLTAEGYIASLDGGEVSDAALENALRSFQERHGLSVDGRVGKETIAALNVSADQRADQIVANMERWRWVPREQPAHRLEVNVAAAELVVYDGNQSVLTMRTIVGSPRHRSPLFQAAIESVLVNPPWNVPRSIIRNEMLPRLRREPEYLLKQDIQILDRPDDPFGLLVDWRNPPNPAGIRLRQRPGPGNALGQIKFELPNPYDVYLHDTPSRKLFEQSRRTLSHGCIRLQHPQALAEHLLGPDPRLAQALSGSETVRIPLARAVPVTLFYWTAFAGPDGALYLRDDVYGHDRRLTAALRRSTGMAWEKAPEPTECQAG